MSKKFESRAQQASSAAAIMGRAVVPDDPPSREEIAALAYSYWEARGLQGGSPEEDWARAEQELRNRRPGPPLPRVTAPRKRNRLRPP
jgi:hypothetical protein